MSWDWGTPLHSWKCKYNTKYQSYILNESSYKKYWDSQAYTYPTGSRLKSMLWGIWEFMKFRKKDINLQILILVIPNKISQPRDAKMKSMAIRSLLHNPFFSISFLKSWLLNINRWPKAQRYFRNNPNSKSRKQGGKKEIRRNKLFREIKTFGEGRRDYPKYYERYKKKYCIHGEKNTHTKKKKPTTGCQKKWRFKK